MAKYRNVKCEIDGIKFDSKFEMSRYCELKLLERAGQISGLELQKPFLLVPKQPGERAVKYISDFCYVENGQKVCEDTKSPASITPAYIIKRKLFKMTYPEYDFREVMK